MTIEIPSGGERVLALLLSLSGVLPASTKADPLTLPVAPLPVGPAEPITKRERFFRRRMAIAGLPTLEAVARRTHLDVSSVSRYIRHRAPSRRGLSGGRIRVYTVLGIEGEWEIPHH